MMAVYDYIHKYLIITLLIHQFCTMRIIGVILYMITLVITLNYNVKFNNDYEDMLNEILIKHHIVSVVILIGLYSSWINALLLTLVQFANYIYFKMLIYRYCKKIEFNLINDIHSF